MPDDEFLGSEEGREVRLSERRSFLADFESLQMLRRVLFSYSIRNHSVGYCQGMNYICAHIMKNVGEEEDIFWLLAQIVEEYMSGAIKRYRV